MGIPAAVRRYLEDREVPFEVVRHPRTASSCQTAVAGHLDPGRLAKAVVLRDEEGYFLAVLPAARDLDLGALEEAFGRRPELVAEEELGRLFPDCALGAVPALGPAYGLDSVVDEAIRGLPEVSFEAGDHEEVIAVRGPDFERLLADAPVGAFSKVPER
jgi:Ala-tRNA(Pro) deacylase